ncbi:MAG: hypothetical protein LPK80_09090 [Bacteroidota bacterium]|nr:hypothetical protein [Bacteroidota bacterium]
MFRTVFNFEIAYRLKRPATYIYFSIFFVITALLVANGGSPATEKVYHNSPVIISEFFGLLGIFSILIGSAVMGVPLNRDLEHDTKEYLLASPMTRSAYFWGRFWGSFVILVFILFGSVLGYLLGTLLGPLTGWEEAERFGPNLWYYYLWPFVTILLPSVFLSSCIFFGLVAITRNNKVLYSASIILFIVYLLGNFLAQDLDNKELVDILDPFAMSTLANTTKYYTPVEQNTLLIPFDGRLMINRLLWPGIGFLILVFSYLRFNVTRFISRKSGKAKDETDSPMAPRTGKIPAVQLNFSARANVSSLFHLTKLEFQNIIRDNYFLSILLGAVAFLFLNGWIGASTYGVPNLPTTISILTYKNYNFPLFVFILLMFYSGESVHRDRSTGFANIMDTLPIPNSVQLFSKFLALTGLCIFLSILPILTGMTIQILKGYTDFQFGLYFREQLIYTFLDYFQLTLLAFFVHVMVNQKFLGHFVGIAIWFLMFILRAFLDMNYNLFFYSYKPSYLISYMNEFGHFREPLFWFNLYWTLFGALLIIFAMLWWTRGSENHIRRRWMEFRYRWNWGVASIVFIVVLGWLGTGAYAYYNVSVLNRYLTEDESLKLSADYEKHFKKYQGVPQPKVIDVKAYTDIYPEKRLVEVHTVNLIVNKTDQPIDSLHILSGDGQEYRLLYNGLRLSPAVYDLIDRPTYTLFYARPDTGRYRIYPLPQTLFPGDTATLEMFTHVRNEGFANSGYSREAIYNGTFTTGNLVGFGYDPDQELSSDEDRKKMDLEPKSEDLPPHHDPVGENRLLFNDDADLITFEAIVSTSPDQIAIAPGYLQKEWVENGRRYFHYKQDSPIQYFFNFVSGRYEVTEDVWEGPNGREVAIQVFHHPSHTVNLNRIIESIQDGLDYYEKNFGPYQFRQVRIMEFPRYAVFAQSFPNTIPYSEDFGWNADFSDPNDYDYVYYVTAHELAHQWWGHQVVPNQTRGSNLISESLAEYSALMVAEKRYGRDNINAFLKRDLDRYLTGRANETKKEKIFIECNRQYQWYQKGSLILYALRDYIGEDELNSALRAFRDSFALKEEPPYPGSYDLYAFIEEVVPDSLNYFLEDTWYKLTLYENRIKNAYAKDLGNGEYEVTLEVSANKMYADSAGNEAPADHMKDYIDIGIFAEEKVSKDGKKETVPLYLQKHKLEAGEHTLIIRVKGIPKKAGIDPYNKLIDRISEDNTKEVDLET